MHNNKTANALIFLLPFIAVPILVACVDFITLLRVRIKKQQKRYKYWRGKQTYNILIPIFGDLKYLKNVEYLKPYGEKVILCTTTKESKKFNKAIDVIAKKYKFKIFRSQVPLATSKSKPNPWRLFHNTLNSKNLDHSIATDLVRDEIIRDSFKIIEADICIFIDGDTTSKENLEILVGVFDEKGYDLASVRVLASKEKTLAEKIQSIEYVLAMDARRVYPWLTSGASMVAKTSVIEQIMSHHSLFFSGGDIEIGKLARLLGYKVGHIPFIFYTDVPETFRAWIKQRIAWFGGGFRHAVVNFYAFSWRHPLFFIYTTIIVYLFTPLRWYAAITHPEIIPIVIVIYWTLLFIFHWKTWKWFYFLFPFYALFQVMFILPMGVYKYFAMARGSKNIGFIKLR